MDNRLKNKITSFIAFGLNKKYDHSSKSLDNFEGSFVAILKYKWALNKKVNKFINDLNEKFYISRYNNEIGFTKPMVSEKLREIIDLDGEKTFNDNYNMIDNSREPIKNLKIKNYVNIFCNNGLMNGQCLADTDYVKPIISKNLSLETLNDHLFNSMFFDEKINSSKAINVVEFREMKKDKTTFYRKNIYRDFFIKTKYKIKLELSNIKLYYDSIDKCFKLNVEIKHGLLAQFLPTIYSVKTVEIKKYIATPRFTPQKSITKLLETDFKTDKILDPDFSKFNPIKSSNEPIDKPFCAYIDSIEETYNDPDPCRTQQIKDNEFFDNMSNSMQRKVNKEKVVSLYQKPKAKNPKKKSKKKKNESFQIKPNKSFV